MWVIDPAAIEHVMDHPARGTPWSARELARTLGCSHATIAYLRSGERKSLKHGLAVKFAEAVGCETAVLFAPALSKKPDTTSGEGVA